jgi:protein-disulfide isomerase
MKRFYIVIGLVALAGAAALWFATSKPNAGRLAAGGSIPAPATDGFQGFTVGSDSAPVEVTEYSDFECPYCAQFAAVQMPTIREQLIGTGKVRWRYRDFPLPSHRHSRLASHAAHCAAEQDKFWEMHDELFFNHSWAQRDRDPSRLFRDFAARIGLDVRAYDACMESGRYGGRIEASRQEGERMGVNGTPTFFINGRPYQGSRSSDGFKAAVENLTGPSR